jgi:hypothetical protein
MTVYVDNMRAPFGRLILCHMIADSDDELRRMARQIGVAQRWHQGDHFDICLSKRDLAVTLGAVQIIWRQCAAMNARRRLTGQLGSPDDAEKWLLQTRRQRVERTNALTGSPDIEAA